MRPKMANICSSLLRAVNPRKLGLSSTIRVTQITSDLTDLLTEEKCAVTIYDTVKWHKKTMRQKMAALTIMG